MQGKLIGINTAIFTAPAGPEGIGFAIPSSIATDIVESLTKTGKVVRGWMGAAIQATSALRNPSNCRSSAKVVLISDVNENGPSHSAGVVTWSLPSMVKRYRASAGRVNLVFVWLPARMPTLKILREGKEQSLKVKVAERPSDEVLAKREPGPVAPQTETVKPPDNVLASLRVQMLDAAMQSQLNIPAKTSGVVVSSVEVGSAAESRC